MKTIVLYGELAKRFGKTHRFAVSSIAESIRALKANCPGFETFLCNAHRDGLGFKILSGQNVTREIEEIHHPVGSSETIRFIPVITGSAKSPFVRIFVGAVLIAASVIALPAGGFSSAGIAMGASMVVGGVAQILTKPPELPIGQTVNRLASFIFSGPENTSAQGKAVPIGYGRMIVGSAVISVGIETYDE